MTTSFPLDPRDAATATTALAFDLSTLGPAALSPTPSITRSLPGAIRFTAACRLEVA